MQRYRKTEKLQLFPTLEHSNLFNSEYYISKQLPFYKFQPIFLYFCILTPNLLFSTEINFPLTDTCEVFFNGLKIAS